jgi:signal recognition particle GTPase
MAEGLQGASKTTVAKLAKHRKEKRKGKKVMVGGADVYRPAAIG